MSRHYRDSSLKNLNFIIIYPHGVPVRYEFLSFAKHKYILRNVGNQTFLVISNFHCMDKKQQKKNNPFVSERKKVMRASHFWVNYPLKPLFSLSRLFVPKTVFNTNLLLPYKQTKMFLKALRSKYEQVFEVHVFLSKICKMYKTGLKWHVCKCVQKQIILNFSSQ